MLVVRKDLRTAEKKEFPTVVLLAVRMVTRMVDKKGGLMAVQSVDSTVALWVES